jgi:hypothetical protein
LLHQQQQLQLNPTSCRRCDRNRSTTIIKSAFCRPMLPTQAIFYSLSACLAKLLKKKKEQRTLLHQQQQLRLNQNRLRAAAANAIDLPPLLNLRFANNK